MTLLGASFSGTAKYKTSSTPCTPSITSVGTFQAQASQSVEILGSCFGTGPALNASDTFNLMISDRSATVPWSACNLGVSDGITCSVSSWTNDEITFTGFNGVYGTVRHRLKAGDELIVAVWNPQTLVGPTTFQTSAVGTSSRPHPPLCVPDITSVGTFQAGATQNVDIDGSCLGSQSPYNDSNNLDLYIQDSSTSPVAWSACNGGEVADIVSCTVSSWTDNQIVLTGFGPEYGEDGFVFTPGDQIIVAVWNPQTSVGPGTFIGAVGTAAERQAWTYECFSGLSEDVVRCRRRTIAARVEGEGALRPRLSRRRGTDNRHVGRSCPGWRKGARAAQPHPTRSHPRQERPAERPWMPRRVRSTSRHPGPPPEQDVGADPVNPVGRYEARPTLRWVTLNSLNLSIAEMPARK